MSAPPILVIENDERDPVGPLGEWLRDAGVDAGDLPSVRRRPITGRSVWVRRTDRHGRTDGRRRRRRCALAAGRAGVTRARPSPPRCPLSASVSAISCWPWPPAGGSARTHSVRRSALNSSPSGPRHPPIPLFGPLPITPDVIQWHRDAVLELPPGAVLLAASPGSEVQAFRIGRLAWGIQFHIETTPAGVRRWAEANAAELADYDVPALLERVDLVQSDLAAVWQPFAAAFAAIVRDPDSVRPARAIRQTTAEPITDPAEIRAALAAQMQAGRGSSSDGAPLARERRARLPMTTTPQIRGVHGPVIGTRS